MNYPASFRFMHFRCTEENGETSFYTKSLSCKGGATVAYVQDEGRWLAAVTFCNPSDNFQYVYGRNKAAGRLIQLGGQNNLADNDKYFIIEADSVEEFKRCIVRHMCGNLGYVYRGARNDKTQEQKG